MENAPITLAHTHARNALLETRRSNPVAASEEHDLAAGEFANAAQSTADAEARKSHHARRILQLLEQHHKKLGQILKSRHEAPHSTGKPEDVTGLQEATPKEKVSGSAPADSSKHVTSPETFQQPPRLAFGTRTSARELSSSIASNLASARGIPGGQRRGLPASPTLSAQHVPGKFAKDQAKTKEVQSTSKTSGIQAEFFSSNDRSGSGKPSWAPPSHVHNDEAPTKQCPPAESSASVNDAPFQQFYKTYENLMSKLSAPLAFAGLPLLSTANSTSQQDKPATPKDAPPPPVEKELDYSQMISRAALRAVQDGQHSSTNPAESFYVVPSTGGTISYADIMSRPGRDTSTLRHTRHLSNVSEDNMEDFVDAKETLPPSTTNSPHDSSSRSKRPINPPPPPPRSRTIPPSSHSPYTTNKSLEELLIENAALKRDTDKLTRRLHVFENSAQSSSAALAQSIRSITAIVSENSHGKPSTTKTPRSLPDDDAGVRDRRIAELEEILRKSDRELGRRERENVKLRETVGRYREKWENLRKSAKARREGGGGGSVAAPESLVREGADADGDED